MGLAKSPPFASIGDMRPEGRTAVAEGGARHSETIIYDNIPAELSAESIANSFSEFKIPVQFYVCPDSNRNVVMELQSADDVRTVLATPLAVESLNRSLTACRLAITAEMARLQVLLRDVPLFLTPEVALATFGLSVAPFGEIVELQRDINPRYPLVHNGKYRLVVRLADVRKPMPHALTITHKGVLTTIPVRFDPKTNIGGFYFSHSPLHARQNCTVAPQYSHCASRRHHSKRCPSRPRTSSPSPTPGETSTAESAARTTSTSSAHRHWRLSNADRGLLCNIRTGNPT
ncbi:hypothetical protein V1514DRAFT_368500 [Lipomyces japonicus]|uniref:uncharacterized protein n=1 Tax=Lipomyces japonicus TaxID=56871 RepID=UPI0034CD5DC6